MKSNMLVLFGALVLSLSAHADVKNVCGESDVGSSSMAEGNLTRAIQDLSKTNKVLGIAKSGMNCYTSDYGIDICRICADVTLKAIPPAPPADGLTIDPRAVTSVFTAETPEAVEKVGCLVLHGNVRDGYTGLGNNDNFHPEGCTPELRAETIGYRKNGKPNKDKGFYLFKTVTTFGHDVSVVIRRSGETDLVLGPVHDKRKDQAGNDDDDEVRARYSNPHLTAKAAIDAVVDGAFNVYWNKQNVCYREVLVLGRPSGPGVMPGIYVKTVPLAFSDCTNPSAGTTAIEREDE